MKLGEWDTLFDAKIAGETRYRTASIDDFNADDELELSADETLESSDDEFSMSGEGSRKIAGGKLTINAALDGNKWQADTDQDIFTVSLPMSSEPDEFWLLNEKENNINTELSIDWVKTSNDWKLRVIGLASSHEHEYQSSYYFEQQDLENTDDSQYEKNTQKTEYIARTTYGKISDTPFKPEFGIEVARNQLDTQLDLVENNIQQVLEGADVVEELRGEVFANFVYITHRNLTIEGGVTAEISEIKVFGEENKNQTFNFIKPRLSANYNINDTSSFTVVAERTVGQLDFNDFAASSDSSDSITTSGNSNLKPEHAIVYSAIYDWRFSERGSLNVEAVYERRKDIHEKIFLPSGNEGLGNAGDASYWSVKTNLNLPIDGILENGLLEISHYYKGSDFYDLIINDTRTIANYIPHYLKIDFRQDVVQYGFSWGMQYKESFEKTKFYVDEIQKYEGNKRFSRLFIETTRFFDMKSRLEIKNVNVSRFTRSRYFYQDDRSGIFDSSEIAHREQGPEIELSFTSTF